MTTVLVLAAIFAARVLFLYVSPFGRCWRCHGRGAVVHGRGKARKCPRCKGARRQQRTGSRTVHRTVRMIRAELARTRKPKEN
jgi:DnaJ-class molecular chaperone